MRILENPLDGITVAIPESRYGEKFASLFERAGARTKLCPLLTEKVLEDRAGIRAFIEAAIVRNFDIVIFMTGIGTNLILQEAEAISKRDTLLAALSRMMVVSRGSKSTVALRKAGIRIDVIPRSATSEGILEAFDVFDIAGKRIAVQLYGTPNTEFIEGLRSRGAEVFATSVYFYEAASCRGDVEAFIRSIIGREIQVIAFTSAPQVDALFDAAQSLDLIRPLTESMKTIVKVASIGEVTTRALKAHHIHPHIVPDQPKMGAMVQAICTTQSS